MLKSIVNPRTGRKVCARVIRVDPQATKAVMAATLSDKKVGLFLLNQPDLIEAMESGMGGEAASSNFALSAFEHALDYRLGGAARKMLRMYREAGKKAPVFNLLVTRQGDIIIEAHNGKLFAE